jgi:hypothetical protein
MGEDQGGPNLYGFAGNDGINGADMLGLWIISRDPSKAWATAMAQTGDTVQSLAALIYLDPTEANKWLKGWNGGPINACSKYQIPNTVGVYTSKPGWFDGIFSYVNHLRNRALNYGMSYTIKGYHVIQLVNQDSDDQFINLWQSDGIYAMIFAGHGSSAGFKAQPSAPGSFQVDPSQVHPPYKLQAVLALCCWGSKETGPNGETWRSFISPTGSYIGFSWYANWLNGWWVEDDVNANNIPPP